MTEAMIDAIEVDNPAEYAERVIHPRVTAIRSLRDDPIGQMHARGHLGNRDSDEAKGRLQRARLFQATWETAGRDGRLRSPDFDGVPGSSDPSKRSGFNDWQRKAGDQLKRWERSLGDTGYELLRMILIDKRTVAEAARHRHGQASRTAVTVTGHRLRECLDELG